jgi:hypothetical protein
LESPLAVLLYDKKLPFMAEFKGILTMGFLTLVGGLKVLQGFTDHHAKGRVLNIESLFNLLQRDSMFFHVYLSLWKIFYICKVKKPYPHPYPPPLRGREGWGVLPLTPFLLGEGKSPPVKKNVCIIVFLTYMRTLN